MQLHITYCPMSHIPVNGTQRQPPHPTFTSIHSSPSTKKNPDQSLVSLTPLRHLALPFSFHTQHPDCLPWLLVYKCPPLLPDRPITLMAKSDPDSEVCRSNSSGLICLCQLFPAIYCYVLPDFLINCTTTVSPLSCSYASVFL